MWRQLSHSCACRRVSQSQSLAMVTARTRTRPRSNAHNLPRCISNQQSHFSSSSSVSPDEVAKFSGMSQSWWDPSLNPLIGMNPTRLDYIQTHAARTDSQQHITRSAPLEGMRALDVGCGGGLLSESLSRLGCHVVAIDPSESLVDCAKLHSENAGLVIDYRGGTSLEQLAQNYNNSNNSDPKFSIICILEVIEHVDNIDSMLHAASQLLDPTSGRLFVSTLNRTYQSYLLAILGAEYVMHYVRPKTHDWNLFRSPELVTDKMRQVGLCPAGPPMGMVLAGPPPPLGTWQWKLSPTDLSVNWIGCYRHVPPTTSTTTNAATTTAAAGDAGDAVNAASGTGQP